MKELAKHEERWKMVTTAKGVKQTQRNQGRRQWKYIEGSQGSGTG